MELFSGKGGVSAALRRHGRAVVQADICHGAHFDLTNPKVMSTLELWIKTGIVEALVMGTPCESMSRARRAPAWSRMPHQLRAKDHPAGLPSLSAADNQKVEMGNLLSRRAARLAQLALSHNVLGLEENPSGSFLWMLHGRPSRSADSRWHRQVFEQCMFGVKYRKRTRIDSWLFSLPALQHTCGSKRCTHSGDKHQVLTSFDGSGFCTSKAAAYPPRMCDHLAFRLHEALGLQTASALWNRFKG